MSARLASGVLVSALIRLASDQGGHGMILQRGAPEAGALLIELRENGRFQGLFERVWSVEGHYQWCQISSQGINSEEEISGFIDRRRRFDPDLWVVELDTANAQRFVAEMPVGA